MPHVVQFGAGAIGRGLLGQLWQEAGYETVFVDTDTALIDALNAQKSYTLRLVDNVSEQTLTINNFRALHASNTEAVFEALRTCDFAATAVGRSQLLPLGRVLLAPGLRRRLKKQGKTPPHLPILLCENGLDRYFLGDLERAYKEAGGRRHVLVPGLIHRMVPPLLSPEEPVVTEPCAELLCFDPHLALPLQNGVTPIRDAAEWAYRYGQKLFLHNGGHLLLALHGLARGHTFIWQALDTLEIAEELHQFWDEVGAGLSQQCQKPRDFVYEAQLLARLKNRAIADTCERVARDPSRKLGAEERLIKAGRLCVSQGLPAAAISRTIVRALQHPEIAPLVTEKGLAQTLQQLSGLSPTHALTQQVLAAAEAL